MIYNKTTANLAGLQPLKLTFARIYFVRSAQPMIMALAKVCVKRLNPRMAGVAVFGMSSVATSTAYTVIK